MKCVVTGGAGMIGSQLCERLLDDGHSVICVDNLASGMRGNVTHLKGKFSFLKHDVRKPLSISCDWLFHLGSRSSPAYLDKFGIEIAMTNALGTYNMLEMATKKKARILFASTSEVYGDPQEHPQKESYWGNVNCFGPRSCYDEGKRFGEALIYSYMHSLKTDARIIRIFNTYGPRIRKDDGRVIPNFISQALANKPITIYGTGKQTRSFCYVTDLVDGMVKLMESNVKEPINVGNPKEITMLEVAETIKRLAGSKSEIVFKPLPEDDPLTRQPDISKARQLLGWEPKVSFEDGLKKTIEWFRQN